MGLSISEHYAIYTARQKKQDTRYFIIILDFHKKIPEETFLCTLINTYLIRNAFYTLPCEFLDSTRSQAVARITDHTASQQTI